MTSVRDIHAIVKGDSESWSVDDERVRERGRSSWMVEGEVIGSGREASGVTERRTPFEDFRHYKRTLWCYRRYFRVCMSMYEVMTLNQ